MSAYGILAKYYDTLMGDFDYDGYFDFVKGGLFGEGADLACGSGEMTVRLAKNGSAMIGMDVSCEMLGVAAEKSKRLALNIKWINMDMRELQLNHCQDFITCVCDGVNYIPSSEISEFFDRVYANVKKGGKFVFDISTEYKLRDILGNNMFCEDYDDVTYIWSNTLRDGYVDMDIDFFESVEGDLYRRVEESHRQFIHGEDFLKSCLDKWQVEVYDGESYSKPKPNSKRLIFVATKL